MKDESNKQPCMHVSLLCMHQMLFNDTILSAEVMRGLSARGSVVVKALCYKPEGLGLDSR
jgi:hypothetical protein